MKHIIRLLWVVIIAAGLYSCTQMAAQVKTEPTKEAPISTNIFRGDGTLNIEIAIPQKEWDYTSVLSDDGLNYTIVVQGIQRSLGLLTSYARSCPWTGRFIRAVLSSSSSLPIDINWRPLKNELGLQIRLTALEPDMEMLSMKTFGGWTDPEHPAKSFQGADHQDKTTVISFDAPVVYTVGEAGGRHYLDIFGVNILPGIIKHKGLLATNQLDGKTRLIFKKNKVQVCPDENDLILGKACKGYVGLSGFTREKNEMTESFLFMLPGRPEMKVMQMKGLTAFGFKDTRLFSRVFKRYMDGDVYKVEAREKDGMLWLIFLYEGDLKYRKYYSGDKFFVVFFRG